ncbi:MAG: hypothetical protein U9Q92_06475 [archaeon]|nr:hypothetical protein [archaeon]
MEKSLTPSGAEERRTGEDIYREILTRKLEEAKEYREMHIPTKMVRWYDEKLIGAIVELPLTPLTDGRYTKLNIPTTRLKGHNKDGIIVEVPFYMEGEVTSEKLVDQLVEISLQTIPYPEYLDENGVELAKAVIKQYVQSDPSATEVVSTRSPTFNDPPNPFAEDIVELAREEGTWGFLNPNPYTPKSEAYDIAGHVFGKEKSD